MPFTNSDLRALLPQAERFRVAAGDGLFVVVYPNGGKYFVWKYRFPPDHSGQQRLHHIGAMDVVQGNELSSLPLRDKIIYLVKLLLGGYPVIGIRRNLYSFH